MEYHGDELGEKPQQRSDKSTRHVKNAAKLGMIVALLCTPAIFGADLVKVALESGTVKPGETADLEVVAHDSAVVA